MKGSSVGGRLIKDLGQTPQLDSDEGRVGRHIARIDGTIEPPVAQRVSIINQFFTNFRLIVPEVVDMKTVQAADENLSVRHNEVRPG